MEDFDSDFDVPGLPATWFLRPDDTRPIFDDALAEIIGGRRLYALATREFDFNEPDSWSRAHGVSTALPQ